LIKKEKYNVAVVGATGLVGEALLDILAERGFPIDKFYALASERSAGSKVSFNGSSISVTELAKFDFSQVDLAFFSAGGAISKEFVPKAAKAGCVVIDNTSEFRYQDDVPLVVPEVNPQAIADFAQTNIIANPNCSTIQMLVALKPIHDAVGIESIDVATYQSVSGSGKSGINELAGQTAKLLNGLEAEPDVYSQQIAFNVLPHIDQFMDDDFTREELKMIWETHKIMSPDILVNPTTVRVPVFYGHSEAVHLQTKKPLTADQAKVLLNETPGILVIDDPMAQQYASPVKHATGKNAVFVSRIRNHPSDPKRLNLWVVSDNIRKGAALNSIQIAEKLIKNYL
jgi:aspartate-semialdehyde dehydrogenase